ncbi:MAG: hypothetical protein FWD31_11560 [Planctomycetaceae bacterium]|nr:hypothetical protein [Planctomycetaceae bacterium]
MTDMLAKGLAWLAGKQKKHVSQRVQYYRGNDCYLVNATLGTTKLDIDDGAGVRIKAHATDFLIRAADLPLMPDVGDRIIFANAVYEVLELTPTGCWCWSDPYAITRRIHTKQIHEVS